MFNRDIKTYILIPEIRPQIRQIYVAKAAGIITFAILSPLILVGFLSVGFVYVFDYMGQVAFWPAHKITNWLHDFQRDNIREVHSLISIEDIQKRLGDKVDEDI